MPKYPGSLLQPLKILGTAHLLKYFKSQKGILLSFEDAIEHCGEELRSQETPLDSLRLAAGRVLLSYEETGYHAPMRILIVCQAQGHISKEDLSSAYSFEGYGKSEYGPLFKKGQEMGQFRDGDPETFGDILWHIIIGYAVQLAHNKDNPVNAELIEKILELFKK